MKDLFSHKMEDDVLKAAASLCDVDFVLRFTLPNAPPSGPSPPWRKFLAWRLQEQEKGQNECQLPDSVHYLVGRALGYSGRSIFHLAIVKFSRNGSTWKVGHFLPVWVSRALKRCSRKFLLHHEPLQCNQNYNIDSHFTRPLHREHVELGRFHNETRLHLGHSSRNAGRRTHSSLAAREGRSTKLFIVKL